MAILIVENDNGWIVEFRKMYTNRFEGVEELLALNSLEDITGAFRRKGFFNNITHAMVDLELGAADDLTPKDLHGRDFVLKDIRETAPWVPVVLVSRFITGYPSILADVTPFDFDAVLPKQYFYSPATMAKQWNNLLFQSKLSRIAHLTGRPYHQVVRLLEKEIELEYGAGVESIFSEYDRKGVETIFKLADFGAERLVLDEMISGFSGLYVIRATCSRAGASVRWLVKIGRNIEKLQSELVAHRKMFTSGFTRRLSVPPLWWAPIQWDNVGLLAYEFEADAETFLAIIKRDGIEKSMKVIDFLLREFYRGMSHEQIVPRKHLNRIISQDIDIDVADRHNIIGALVRKTPSNLLDTSLRISAGIQHGDLHCRNVLVSRQGTCMIDFANYIDRRSVGLPILDFCNLAVDISIFGRMSLQVRDLLSDDYYKSEAFARLHERFVCGGVASPEEIRLIRMGIIAYYALYLGYADVEECTKKEIKEALMGDYQIS